MFLKVLMLLDNPFKSDARVEKEAISLVEAGYTVTVFAVEDNTLPAEEIRDGYRIKRVFTWQFNSPLKRGFNNYINQTSDTIANEPCDALHCHDFYMLYIGMIVKQKKPQIKLIYDSHEYLVGWPFYLSNSGLLNKIKGYWVWRKLILNEKKAIAYTDVVITITPAIAQRLKQNTGLKALPFVISNFPNQISVQPDKNYFREKYNLSKEIKIIVHSGTIYHTDKQLKTLFDILVNSEKFILVFVGNRPRFEEIKNRVLENSSLNRKVFFHPYLANQSEIVNLLSCADIGLMHIRDEWEAHKIGFSNRFVEYILAEIPVVATPQEFTKEINKTFPCSTFYMEDDSLGLEAAINKMADNYESYHLGVVSAKQIFNWSTEEAKLLHIYNELFNTNK